MVSPGRSVARVVDLDPVKVDAGVPERYAADVQHGREAEVSFDVFPGEVFQAPVRYVGATVNPQNRTFPVEVVLPNPEGSSSPRWWRTSPWPGACTDAVVVPQDALVRVEDGYVVFVAANATAKAPWRRCAR